MSLLNAIAALRELDIKGDHAWLADYWLSLWQDNQLPARADFHPQRVCELLPGIAIFEVKPNVGVHCRIAGSYFLHRFGLDIARKDWLAITPPEARTLRLARNTRIATGAISLCRRRDPNRSDEGALITDIQLPFRPEPGGETTCYLHRSDWKPRNVDRDMKRPRPRKIVPAEEFIAIDLGLAA